MPFASKASVMKRQVVNGQTFGGSADLFKKEALNLNRNHNSSKRLCRKLLDSIPSDAKCGEYSYNLTSSYNPNQSLTIRVRIQSQGNYWVIVVANGHIINEFSSVKRENLLHPLSIEYEKWVSLQRVIGRNKALAA